MSKKLVKYECGCEYWYETGTIPEAKCETHGRPIKNMEIKLVSVTCPGVLLDDKEVISDGCMIQFNIGDRVVRLPIELLSGKMTVGELKKYLYDEGKIDVVKV